MDRSQSHARYGSECSSIGRWGETGGVTRAQCGSWKLTNVSGVEWKLSVVCFWVVVVVALNTLQIPNRHVYFSLYSPKK